MHCLGDRAGDLGVLGRRRELPALGVDDQRIGIPVLSVVHEARGADGDVLEHSDEGRGRGALGALGTTAPAGGYPRVVEHVGCAPRARRRDRRQSTALVGDRGTQGHVVALRVARHILDRESRSASDRHGDRQQKRQQREGTRHGCERAGQRGRREARGEERRRAQREGASASIATASSLLSRVAKRVTSHQRSAKRAFARRWDRKSNASGVWLTVSRPFVCFAVLSRSISRVAAQGRYGGGRDRRS